MILGSSHPSNTERSVTIECQPGGAYLVMTPDEFERFQAGQPVVKRSGDCRGDFTIKVTCERPDMPTCSICGKYNVPLTAIEDGTEWRKVCSSNCGK